MPWDPKHWLRRVVFYTSCTDSRHNSCEEWPLSCPCRRSETKTSGPGVVLKAAPKTGEQGAELDDTPRDAGGPGETACGREAVKPRESCRTCCCAPRIATPGYPGELRSCADAVHELPNIATGTEIWPEFGEVWPLWAAVWLMLAKVGHYLTEFVQTWTALNKLGPTLF